MADGVSPRNFSPVPKRVMDGSEPVETVPAAVLSGAPTDLQARTVRYGHTDCRMGFPCRNGITNQSITESTVPRSRLHSRGRGTVTAGGWTGTFCSVVTDGRTL